MCKITRLFLVGLAITSIIFCYTFGSRTTSVNSLKNENNSNAQSNDANSESGPVTSDYRSTIDIHETDYMYTNVKSSVYVVSSSWEMHNDNAFWLTHVQCSLSFTIVQAQFFGCNFSKISLAELYKNKVISNPSFTISCSKIDMDYDFDYGDNRVFLLQHTFTNIIETWSADEMQSTNPISANLEYDLQCSDSYVSLYSVAGNKPLFESIFLKSNGQHPYFQIESLAMEYKWKDKSWWGKIFDLQTWNDGNPPISPLIIDNHDFEAVSLPQSGYWNGIENVWSTELNRAWLITVDDKNSFIHKGPDNFFYSHFNLKLNTDYIEKTIMLWDIIANQVAFYKNDGNHETGNPWVADPNSESADVYNAFYDKFQWNASGSHLEPQDVMRPINNAIIQGHIVAPALSKLYSKYESNVVLPGINQPICNYYLPTNSTQNAINLMRRCLKSCNNWDEMNEVVLGQTDELAWYKNFEAYGKNDGILWYTGRASAFTNFANLVVDLLTTYLDNSFTITYKIDDENLTTVNVSLAQICDQCNVTSSTPPKKPQDFMSIAVRDKTQTVSYTLTLDNLNNWLFGELSAWDNGTIAAETMGICYLSPNGSFDAKSLDGESAEYFIFNCSWPSNSSMLNIAPSIDGVFNDGMDPTAFSNFVSILTNATIDEIIDGLRDGYIFGYPFTLKNFFKVDDAYSSIFVLDDIIYTNNFAFYKAVDSRLAANVYTKDFNEKITKTWSVKVSVGFENNSKYVSKNKFPSYYTGGAQETNVENVLNDLIVYFDYKLDVVSRPFKTSVSKVSFKSINAKFFSSWSIIANDQDGTLTVSGQVCKTTSTDDPGQNFCLVASGFLKTSSDLFDFNFQYKNSDGSFAPFHGEPYFTKKGDVVRAIAKASSSATQLEIDVNGKLPDNVQATKYNQVGNTITVDYELLTDVNSTYINSFFTVYATDNDYNTSKMHNIYERYEINPTTTTVNIQNEKTITETIQFNDKNKKSSSDYSAIQTFNGSPDNTKIRWTAILVSVNGSPSSDDQKKLFTGVDVILDVDNSYSFSWDWNAMPNPTHEDIYEFEIQATSDSNATVFDTATYTLIVNGDTTNVSSLSGGAIAGIVLGSIGAIGVGTLVYFWIKKHRTSSIVKKKSKEEWSE